MYKTILEDARTEEEIKKSRFISHIKKVKTEEDALDFIRAIKEKHRDATHNCWAYHLGKKGLIQRYDDDGEPQKTAGVPILEVIKNKKITDVCIVVTRYFGGTLLGSGGLIRAYAGGANAVIEEAKIVDMCPYFKVKLQYDYSQHGSLEYFFKTKEIPLDPPLYTDKVQLRALVEEERWDWFSDQLNNLTAGGVEFLEKTPLDLAVRNNKVIYKNKSYQRSVY
ncbi:MAG: YigZ family protein [Tissierellia bacterium]|nr:YigZ family protein [Tissierellia bacterium]